jgi:SseB protein N-terminal domain
VTSGEDVGAPDPRLTRALAAGDVAAVRSALLSVRLIAPLLASGDEASAAEIAVPRLVGTDGRLALPVFSGVEALRAWRPLARPVPVNGATAVVAAVEDGNEGLVLDVAGPVTHVVETADLMLLAEAARRLLAGEASGVHVLDG